MASEIRVNQIQNRSGLSTVTFSDSGVILSGVTTVTSTTPRKERKSSENKVFLVKRRMYKCDFYKSVQIT